MTRAFLVLLLVLAGPLAAQDASTGTEADAPAAEEAATETSADSAAAAPAPATSSVLPIEMLSMSSQTPSPVPVDAEPGTDPAVAQGQYLVHHVAMCVQCHSPRQPNGSLVADQLLMCAPVPVNEPSYVKDWAYQAPAIAGLPGYSKEDMVRLLTEGITRDGTYPASPMPPFRMKPEDAQAIADYLDSLRRGR